MDIIISTNQLDRLKSTYSTKYVDNSELYKGPPICNGVNQNLNKLKIIDIIEQYGELTHDYPSIFKREKPIGECEDGSPIQLYTLNKTKTEKPIILIVGGVHGDEKTSIYGIYETVKFLLLGSKWSRFITSNFVVQIVPCLNVYGFNNNKRNNSNDKDLNRDFIKTTQKETKALTDYIKKNKDRIKIILDSHNAYNEEFVSCKQEMKYFEVYEDIAFKLNLFLNGKYDSDDKKSFLWISRSKNDGTLSDFINKNKFIGHTVESPRSLTKEIHYPNPINYEDGAEVTKDLLVNLMYIYGKMYNKMLLTENKRILYESDVDELQGFHGSQSNFNKFNHKKFLSSGAGSQVFGWGTYITDDVAIATDYANIHHDEGGLTYFKPKHKIVYEVEIPDNNGSNYIEWYERFPKEFMVRVLQALASLKPKFIEMMSQNSYPFKSNLGDYLQHKANPNFNKLINCIANEDDYHTFFADGMYSNRKEGDGKDVYRMLATYMGSPKAASLFLNQCGFDGITYPTGTRMAKPNGAKKDGKNYVIFDASKIKITNKTNIQ